MISGVRGFITSLSLPLGPSSSWSTMARSSSYIRQPKKRDGTEHQPFHEHSCCSMSRKVKATTMAGQNETSRSIERESERHVLSLIPSFSRAVSHFCCQHRHVTGSRPSTFIERLHRSRENGELSHFATVDTGKAQACTLPVYNSRSGFHNFSP